MGRLARSYRRMAVVPYRRARPPDSERAVQHQRRLVRLDRPHPVRVHPHRGGAGLGALPRAARPPRAPRPQRRARGWPTASTSPTPMGASWTSIRQPSSCSGRVAPRCWADDSGRRARRRLRRRDGGAGPARPRWSPVPPNVRHLREQLSDVAGRPAGVVVVLHEITERVHDRRRLERILEDQSRVAAALQASMVPPTLPDVRGIELASQYLPAGDGREVGGDFLDVFDLGKDTWGFVLGDVSGKGAEAATVSAATRYTLRALAAADALPSETVRKVNTSLLGHTGLERHCTLVYGLVRPELEGATVVFTLAGHHPPIVLRAAGEAEEVGALGTALALFDDPELHDTTVHLGPARPPLRLHRRPRRGTPGTRDVRGRARHCCPRLCRRGGLRPRSRPASSTRSTTSTATSSTTTSPSCSCERCRARRLRRRQCAASARAGRGLPRRRSALDRGPTRPDRGGRSSPLSRFGLPARSRRRPCDGRLPSLDTRGDPCQPT